MNKTESKILGCALEMYNEFGIDAITVRHIAKKMDIRHSNITYYFPKKDDIVDVLYHKMQGEIDELLDEKSLTTRDIFDLSVFKKGFHIIYKYRFVYVNHAEIFKRLPHIKSVYDDNREKRKTIFLRIANDLNKHQFFRDNVEEEYLKLLIQNVTLINDFWVVYCDLNPGRTYEQQKRNYLKLILNAFLPHLTPKGVENFKKAISNL